MYVSLVDYLPWATIDTILLIKRAEAGGEPDALSLSHEVETSGFNFVNKNVFMWNRKINNTCSL